MPEIIANLNIKDHHWSRILRDIERGDVVPVIGPELLEIEHEGITTLLYDVVAQELVEQLAIDVAGLERPYSLCDLVYLHRQQVCDPLNTDPYHLVYEILNSREWPIPAALEKLAQISHFNLFVSTTPDDLLVNALRKRNHATAETTQVYSYSPDTELNDLPDSFEDRAASHSTVFKLFGDVSMRPDFAITEEDILRYVHHLQIRDERPANLFDLLRSRSLTMLGCSFDNWLARFLLCSAKADALFSSHGTRGVVADRNTSDDQRLLPFLNRNRTLLFSEGDALGFVDQLHQRWTDRFGDTANNDVGESAPAETQQDPDLADEVVFISYASEDRDAAIRVRDCLNQYNISVWLDQSRLEGGDVYEELIRDRIKECVIFIPIISEHTITGERRFFRMEWSLAVEEARKWPDSYPYIQPIVVDGASFNSPDIPAEFRRRHFNQFPDGVVDNQFAQNLVRTLRRYQQRVSRYQ